VASEKPTASPSPNGQVVAGGVAARELQIMYSITQSVSETEMQSVFCELGISLLNIV
jgi:hypothetical protein